MMMTTNSHAIVLGAGIQGVCTALALRRRGLRVTMVDREERVMEQASLRNEGKVHLGFVYAKDGTGRTPLLMLEAAMNFAPLLEHWLDRSLPWHEIRSNPFVYGLLSGSMLDRDAILESYTALQGEYEALVSDPSLHYFGDRPDRLWEYPGRELARFGKSLRGVRAMIPTVEVALEPGGLRDWLEQAIRADENIEFLPRHRVDAVVRTPEGFRVSGDREQRTAWSRAGDVVVNCLWSNRLALDRAFLGTSPTRSWVYRLKYRLLGHLPAVLSHLPSMTFVLGPFGDIVTHRTARTYFSWYPSCMQGWNGALTPPGSWESACKGRPEPETARSVTEASLQALGGIVPGIEASRIETVDAGVIFSWGETDIDDSQSELHERYDIGVNGGNGYYSIDTGKFTCAPLFAERLAELVA